MAEPSLREGRLVVDDAGHELWYRLYGEAPETLVCLHGGPGGGSSYLWPLGQEVAGEHLEGLISEQLGSPRSDRADDAAAYTVEAFVQELEQVRRRLEL